MRERLNIRNIKLGLFTRYQIRFSSLGLIVVRAQTDLYAKFYNTVCGTALSKCLLVIVTVNKAIDDTVCVFSCLSRAHVTNANFVMILDSFFKRKCSLLLVTEARLEITRARLLKIVCLQGET